jgi:hypothetical protein
MIGMGFGEYKFTPAGFFETLCSSSIGLDLRHFSILLATKKEWREKAYIYAARHF